MQKLWAENLHWDQPLSSQYLPKWYNYWESLSELDTQQIPHYKYEILILTTW